MWGWLDPQTEKGVQITKAVVLLFLCATVHFHSKGTAVLEEHCIATLTEIGHVRI